MHRTRALGGLFALTIVLAACGSNGGTDSQADAAGTAGTATGSADGATGSADVATTAPAGTDAGAGSAGSALLGTSPVGDILTGPDGRSLYGFTNDTAAASTCYGTCAEAWPPVIVPEGWDVGPGLDTGIFATTERDDGQLQLVAGKWPLYYYTGDAVPGDVKGQGSGDVWFVVDPEGSLVTEAEGSAGEGGDAAELSTATTDLGEVLATGDGLTLYGLTEDTEGEPTCVEACAGAWPPVIVDELPADLDPEIYSTVERPDGKLQLKAGIWPLYQFAGDTAEGDLNGQGSGGVWFAVAPDGSLLKDGASSSSGEGGASDGDGATDESDDPYDEDDSGY